MKFRWRLCSDLNSASALWFMIKLSYPHTFNNNCSPLVDPVTRLSVTQPSTTASMQHRVAISSFSIFRFFNTKNAHKYQKCFLATQMEHDQSSYFCQGPDDFCWGPGDGAAFSFFTVQHFVALNGYDVLMCC